MKTTCSFLLLVSVGVTPLLAQWVQTERIYGGFVYSFAISGTNLFAGTYGGVFLSTNNGTSWTAAGLPNSRVNALAFSGANLFAGTDGNGVFLSTNNGTNWTAVNTGLTNPIVQTLAVLGTNLFVGTLERGAFLSTNNGTSWTAVNSGLTNPHVLSLAVSGTNLFAGTSSGGVFLSSNNGANWAAVNTGLTNTVVMSLAFSGTNLFAGTFGDGAFLSTNNGTSWTPINTGLPEFNYVDAFAFSGTNLFAGTYRGVFLSTNNGTSWSAINTGLASGYVYALAVLGTNLFAGNSGAGVFLSTNSGTSWTAVNTGLTNLPVLSLAVSGTNIFAGTSCGGVYLSTNNGTSWTAVNTGLTNTIVQSLAVSGTSLFAGTTGGVFLSTNNGTSWTAANTGLANTAINALVVSGTNLFAGTHGDGVFLSTNNGANWKAVNTDLANLEVRSFAVSGTNLFAGTYPGGVFLSTNNGTNWTAVNTGLTNANVYALAVLGTNLFAGTYPGGVFLSTNNGTSWTAVNTGLASGYVYALAVTGSNLFAGTGDFYERGGLYLSTNNGTSWTAAGLPNSGVHAFAVSGTNLLAGTYNDGVWRRPLSEMTAIPTSCTVSGAVRYGSSGGSPIRDVNMILVSLTTGNQIASATDSSGLYLFANLPSGAYSLIAAKVGGFPSAYVNAADALKAQLYFIDPLTYALSSLQQSAADVNGDGQVNSADGLQIVLRYVGTLSSFVKGDWVFAPGSSNISVGSQNVNDDIIGLAVGDVNGDAQPRGVHFAKEVGSAGQSVILHSGSSRSTNPSREFDIPVRLRANATIGSISLKFQYPSESASFIGVDGPEGMVSAEHNGEVALAWFSAEHALNLKENDALITIRFKPTGCVRNFSLTLDPTSQMTDDRATVLAGVGLEIPIIDAHVPSEFALRQNYPNPFNPTSTIRYDLPKSATVSLNIYNTLGQLVATLVDERKVAGFYQATWNATNVPSGIFFFRLRAGEFVETKKMILQK